MIANKVADRAEPGLEESMENERDAAHNEAASGANAYPKYDGSGADLLAFPEEPFPDYDWAANLDFTDVTWTPNTFTGTLG